MAPTAKTPATDAPDPNVPTDVADPNVTADATATVAPVREPVSAPLPGKGAMYVDQYGRTWFIATGDEVPEEWTKVDSSPPLEGEQLDPNNPDGTAFVGPVTTASVAGG